MEAFNSKRDELNGYGGVKLSSNSSEYIKQSLDALKYSRRTYNTYLYEMNCFSKWLKETYGDSDLSNLTHSEVQTYMDSLQARKYSARSITIKYSAIRTFCLCTGQQKACISIRRVTVQGRTAPKALNRLERLKLIRNVERDGSPRNIAIVKLLIYTGMRVSELCELDVDDIELHERSGWVRIRRGKGNRERQIPVPIEARKAVGDYLATREGVGIGDPLFKSNRETRIQTRTVQHILEQYGTHPHALRHTYCRMLVESGVDIVTVSELAGHSDINTTTIYSRPTSGDMEKVIDMAFGLGKVAKE